MKDGGRWGWWRVRRARRCTCEGEMEEAGVGGGLELEATRGRCRSVVRRGQVPTSYPLFRGLGFILRVWEVTERF